ncbi:MAG: hypothetical protein KGL56_11020 [Alphaproteobacteria bacterium]|nr:hypothetical protein [Alphaproteobacteria bacterium]MDE2500710.1 hypothetical protein [Alphaproteobacteria bacterium]
MNNPLKTAIDGNDTAWALTQQAQKLLDAGQCEAAALTADAALQRDRDSALAWLVKGQACKALRRLPEAVDAFNAVLTFAPALAGVHVNLANTYAELDRLPEAKTHLLKAVALKPDLAAAHASLGSIYMRMARLDLALEPSRQALALDPNLIAAHQNLASALSRSDPAQAQIHRDAAYREQQIFVERSAGSARTALILLTADTGNIPYKHLLPLARYSHVKWHIEYAPEGQERDLPDYDFIFNAIGDPDVAGPAQMAAERFVAKSTRPLVNRPECVARTYRSAMPALLGHIPDLVVPKVLRHARDNGKLDDALTDMSMPFPLIVRPAGLHGGDGMSLIKTPDELASATPDADILYATQFVDYRSDDGLYRKYRVIFVDRTPYPYHLAIGQRWVLHYKSADMNRDAVRREEEERFLSDPEGAIGARATAALVAIGAELDLDYAGIDFGILPDGRLLFFEANATMLVHPEDDPLFLYKNKAVDSILEAMSALIERKLQANSAGK